MGNDGLPEASQTSRRATSSLNDLSAREWVQHTKSIVFQRGLGADHPETSYERLHPCPFSYRVAERLIAFFTKHGENVLDPFVGVASTLKACALSGRFGTGIELNLEYCGWGSQRLKAEVAATNLERFPQRIIQGDARSMVATLLDDEFHFVLTSPPYWSILKKRPDAKGSTSTALRNGTLAYSDDPRDFGCIEDYDMFVQEVAAFVNSWRRVLQVQRYIAIIVADFRDGSVLFPFSADLIGAIKKLPSDGNRQLVLQGIKILAQDQKRLFPYGYPTTYVPNIHHHYILIYRNILVSGSQCDLIPGKVSV